MINIGINGFGRIGRTFFRLIYEKKNNLKIKFINDVNKTNLSDNEYRKNLVYLLKNDSIYGRFFKKIVLKNDILFVQNQKIKFFIGNIKDIKLDKYKIDTLVDCSGANYPYLKNKKNFKNFKNFKIVVSSNHSDADFTLVYGVNNDDYSKAKHKIISASTCTGQAFIPFAKFINDNFSIKNGFINTVHPCLPGDTMIDDVKKKFHYGRSSKSVKLVETMVVQSTEKVIPNIKNKLFDKSLSFRIPTESVTAVMGVIQVSKRISGRKELINLIKRKSKNILICEGFNDQPLVSIDYLKNKHPCILSSEWLDVSNQDLIRFNIWQDNEFAYCCQLLKTVFYVNSKN